MAHKSWRRLPSRIFRKIHPAEPKNTADIWISRILSRNFFWVKLRLILGRNTAKTLIFQWHIKTPYIGLYVRAAVALI